MVKIDKYIIKWNYRIDCSQKQKTAQKINKTSKVAIIKELKRIDIEKLGYSLFMTKPCNIKPPDFIKNKIKYVFCHPVGSFIIIYENKTVFFWGFEMRVGKLLP
jgi:hypothetical protein